MENGSYVMEEEEIHLEQKLSTLRVVYSKETLKKQQLFQLLSNEVI